MVASPKLKASMEKRILSTYHSSSLRGSWAPRGPINLARVPSHQANLLNIPLQQPVRPHASQYALCTTAIPTILTCRVNPQIKHERCMIGESLTNLRSFRLRVKYRSVFVFMMVSTELSQISESNNPTPALMCGAGNLLRMPTQSS